MGGGCGNQAIVRISRGAVIRCGLGRRDMRADEGAGLRPSITFSVALESAAALGRRGVWVDEGTGGARAAEGNVGERETFNDQGGRRFQSLVISPVSPRI